MFGSASTVTSAAPFFVTAICWAGAVSRFDECPTEYSAGANARYAAWFEKVAGASAAACARVSRVRPLTVKDASCSTVTCNTASGLALKRQLSKTPAKVPVWATLNAIEAGLPSRRKP